MNTIFEGGVNIAVKIPKNKYEATVAFYRDVLLLDVQTKSADAPTVSETHEVKFGRNTLWLDCVDNYALPQIWLELNTTDVPKATAYLQSNNVPVCDELEQLSENMHWIQDPAGNVFIIKNTDEKQEKENRPQSAALEIIMPTYRWHTQMFDNMLKDISTEDALQRIVNRTNHMVWTAGNLVNNRYWLANVLGIDDKDPHDDIFKDGKALDANAAYPDLEALKKNWHHISQRLYKKLLTVTDAELNKSYSLGMNVEFFEENKLNAIGMTMDRASYLLGQLALMRRAIVNKGTNYDVNKELEY